MLDELYPKLRTGLKIEAPDHLGMTTSCINCVSFNEPIEICNKWNIRPPARVIAFGCPDYFDAEEVPF